MRAILTFNLPKEQAEHDLAIKGGEWAAVVASMDMELRNALKYKEMSDETRKALDELRTLLFEEMQYRGVSL